MDFKYWEHLLAILICIGILFVSCSCSFAADLEDSSGFLVADDLDKNDGVRCLDVDSSSDCLSDSPSDSFVEDDAVFNDDVCVDNWAEDSCDDVEDLDSGSVVNPRSNPLDNRIVSRLDVSSFSKYYRNGTQLIGHLRDSEDNPLEGRIVSIGIVGVVYNCTTDSEGMFHLNINLYPNNYTTNISFDGDTDYQPCSKSIMVKVFTMPTTMVASDLVKYYRNASQLCARLLDVHGNPLSGKLVVFKINNVRYNHTTDDEGYAVLNINMLPCTTSFIINFTSSGYKSSQKVVSVTVLTMPTTMVASDLVKYYRNASQLRARLLDVQGNPLMGKTLTFKIDNVHYNRTTDDEGYAVLNINLMPCTTSFIINFTSSGYKSSQKVVSVTVLVMPTTLESPDLVKYYRNGSQWVARLLDGNGNPLVGKTLSFTVGSSEYNRTTDEEGYAVLIINLSPRNVNYTVSFKEKYYYNVSRTVNINVLDPPVPSVNYPSGVFNCSSLVLNFSAYHENATVFCSFDNGTNWYNNMGNLCFNLSVGNWSVLSYVGLDDYNSSICSFDYLVDNYAPVVWASHGSAIYNESFYVELSVWDDLDTAPLIYYTIDGSSPDENSSVYDGSIFIDGSCNFTALRFVSVDFMGNWGSVVNVHYFFGDLVANLNSGKCFASVQEAVDDNDTFEGDIIEVSKDLCESVLLNKSVYLRACDFKDVLWESEEDLSCVIFDSVVGAIVESFVFKSNNYFSGVIVFDNSSNCFVVDNIFFTGGHSIIMDRLSVNDFNSFHDISFNNFILHNQFYGSGACINLNYCINYSIMGNDFNKINQSLFDLFEIDYGSGGYNWGIYIFESFNSLFANNSFFNMGYDGIYLSNSTNDTIANNIFSMGDIGVNILANNSIISNNNFTNNSIGISIIGSNNNIISNLISENGIGIFSVNSNNTNINFNRIVHNEQFGLYILEGCVNATNNWWGSNNLSVSVDTDCDIYFSNNFDLIYDPYIVLNTYVTSFRRNQFDATIYYADDIILDYSLSEAVCVVDLRRNNFGEDVSYLGTVPDGSVLFVQGTPILHSHFVPLVNGVGSYFAPEEVGDDIVLVIFDDIYQTLSIDDVYDGAIFCFDTAGIVLGYNSSFRCYNFNLNYNINWVSFVWKYVGDFRTEFNLIFDGYVVDNFTVESSFYHENVDNYSINVWRAIELYNDFLYNKLSNNIAWTYVCIALDYGLSTFEEVEGKYYDMSWRNYTSDLKFNLTLNGSLFNTTLLNLIKDKYNLCDDEINFIFCNHLNVRDSVMVGFDYLGSEREVFSFDLGNSMETYSFIGSSSCRAAEISCVNGAYAHRVGNNASDFEENWTNVHLQNGTVEWVSGYSYGYYANAWYDGLMTFAFANNKVNDSVLSYWLNESNRTCVNGSLVFDVGPMKAAYGSFLEALLVIYMEDLVADAAAERYNVTWSRISPMVMSVHDNVLETYMSGECDFRFGREAYGSLDNVKAFYFACSASFSLIEHYVSESLFPGGSDLDAVTTGLNYILEHNGTLEVFVQDGCVLIREEGNNERVLIFDSVTGLLHDAYYGLNGAFCYSNQQTDWALLLGIELLDNHDSILLYLLNQDDLPNLTEPAGNMVKSCKFFLGMGTLFVVEDVGLETFLGTLGTFAGSITISTLAVPLIITLPLIFLIMEPVGIPNENEIINDFYESHNSSNVGGHSINGETVQIRNNKKFYYEDNYERSYTIARDLGLFSTLTPSLGDEGNISLFNTILVIAGVSYALGSFYISPYVLNKLATDFTIDCIKIEFNETTNKTDIIIYYK